LNVDLGPGAEFPGFLCPGDQQGGHSVGSVGLGAGADAGVEFPHGPKPGTGDLSHPGVIIYNTQKTSLDIEYLQGDKYIFKPA